MGKNIDIKDNIKNKDKWQQILKQWIDNNKKYYEKLEKNDVIFWHKEEANNSALLVAIWQMGGIATLEYAIKKQDTKEGGYADIFCKIDDISYIIECKYKRQDEKDDDIKLENLMKKAKTDCEKINLSDEKIDEKMAIVFITPFVNNEEGCENYNDYDMKAVFSLEQNIEYEKKEEYKSIYLFAKLVSDKN